jgi:hypothetical protein
MNRFLQALSGRVLMNSSIVFGAVVLSLAVTAGPASAQQKPSSPATGQQKKEAPTPVTGELLAVDDKSKTIVVKAGETEMKFSYSDQTEIVGTDKGIEGLAGKGGTVVKVTYDEHGTANVALRIEVTQKTQ